MRGTIEAATVADLAETFIHKRMEDSAPGTIRVYRSWLLHGIVTEGPRRHPGGIAAHIPDLAAFDSLNVTKYFTQLREWEVSPGRPLGASSRHQAFRTVKTFSRWVMKYHGRRLLHGDPMEDVGVALPKALPSVPRAEDLQKMLDACGDTLAGLRNRVVILMMCDSGLRRQEALSLRVTDHRHGDRESLPSFFVRMGKGGKDRMISCGEETSKAIRKYLAARRDDYGPLDPLVVTESGQPLTGRGVSQILHRLCAKAEIPRDRWVHPHGLRHFMATNWLRAGVDLERIRLQLGHENISTTQRYLSLVPDDVQKAHVRASPLMKSGIKA